MIKYGIEVQLPDGKRPGFYAQFVKSLAGAVRLFDRDKEMLIVESEAEREAVIGVMRDYNFDYEEFELVLLPDDAEVRPAFTDYGFTSLAGNAYLYRHLTAVFTFGKKEETAGGEREHALAQMEEHLIARFALEGMSCYAVDRSLADLMRGIAKAYRCSIEFIW